MQNNTEESKQRLLNNLKGIQLSCQNTTVHVPITTNKLKNLCKRCLSFNDNKIITTQMLYRVTLTQLFYQLHRSEMVRTSSLPGCAYDYKKNHEWFQQYENAIIRNDKNYFPLAHLINSVGSYSHGEINFQAYVPSEIEEDGQIIPDPFKVTIVNLFEFVRYLSKKDTDLEIRKYFRKHDPLPDAEWSDDCQLLNPDDIIPKNYNPEEDHELQLYFSGARNQYLFRKCNFDGKGNAIQLVNVKEYSQHEVETSCSYNVKDVMVYNLAAIFMIGERPSDVIKEAKEIWDFRCSEQSSFRFDALDLWYNLMRPKNLPPDSDSDSDY